MGMDINEFCGAAGMAVDAYKRGLPSRDDTDGLILDWGWTDAFERLILQTANRQGLGDVIAEGTRGAAQRIGGEAPRYALHMKGMHWPGHSAPPFTLAFSTATRGGDFLKGVPFLLLGEGNQDLCRALLGATPRTMDIYSHADKGRAVWWHENYKAATDSLGTCFYLGLTLLPHLRPLPEDLGETGRLGIIGENPLPLHEIVRSPRKEDIRLRLRTRLLHRVRDVVSRRITKDSEEYREHFRRIWQRKGRKSQVRSGPR
jgi:aldehyde:ferredoxin oxidoreductase